MERTDFAFLGRVWPNGHPWLDTMSKAVKLADRIAHRETMITGGGRPQCAAMEMIATRCMLDGSTNFSMMINASEVVRGNVRIVGPWGPCSELARFLDINPNGNPDLERLLMQALGITKWDLYYLTSVQGQGGWLTSGATRPDFGGLLLHFSRTLRRMDHKEAEGPREVNGYPVDVRLLDSIPLSEQHI